MRPVAVIWAVYSAFHALFSLGMYIHAGRGVWLAAFVICAFCTLGHLVLGMVRW